MLELSLHVLDLLRNAVEAGATRVEVLVDEQPEEDRLVLRVRDNGRGMPADLAAKVTDPFVTTRRTRRVGLGLPFLDQAARGGAGRRQVCSEASLGTTVTATFRHGHLDRAPLGDMPATLMALLLSGDPVEIDYLHRVGRREYRFSSREVRRALSGVPLTHPRVRDWLASALEEGERSLDGRDAGPPLPLRKERP